MLSKENNELLCRVGPGTPMGNVFRRFWNPIVMAKELPEADGTPLRVRILGENLVLFRDSSGQLGLLDELCLHRRTSLALGRVEEMGIRCLYHGWKFSTDGKLMEVPNCKDPRIQERLRTRAYPVREAGGLAWAYMGPPQLEPPLPNWRFMQIPPENVLVSKQDTGSNYMQVYEGGADSSHVGILHTNAARPGWIKGKAIEGANSPSGALLASDDLAPDLELEDTEFGFHYAALREMPSEDGEPKKNIRIMPLIMPSTRIIPSTTMQFVVFEVPIDDVNTRSLHVAYRLDGEAFDKSGYDRPRGRDNPELLDPVTFRYLGSWENRFGQDRDAMKQDWTGIRGVIMEDIAITMSPGPLIERHEEHLVPADAAVVRARKQLLDSAQLVQDGQDPIGLCADLSAVIACDETISVGRRWQELAPGHKARSN
ncbi:hypothetical protein AU184_08865 [Mycolicibacterium novocastrense]|uniref:Rieske 2Fe-2S domain-containing protein n=1 Tax=Mycolicibacterium novocastrense TaxID=59813 RepID=UPI000747C4CC|nr:Rieske 2Fe-2S domain-containing protein [Mycolicibacterium novocastrense]KUH69835.1 hypothetical protein AU184_08865 [Mycolicibacterium novocastrense]KUH71409.1 hypothetical protein AU183_06235 [Mycolicibacterium novocastrense]KUH74461.1 hypothetical protein AU072_17650 [Mycolicibacterium novocastrense]